MRMQFGVLTILLAVLAVSVLLGLTHNQIREYFYPKSALMSEREFWKVIDDARKHGTSDDKLRKGLVTELGKLSDDDVRRFAKRFGKRKGTQLKRGTMSCVPILFGRPVRLTALASSAHQRVARQKRAQQLCRFRYGDRRRI